MRTTTRRNGAEASAGYHWVAVPDIDPDWRLQTDGGCRASASKGTKACGRPAVAALNRRYRRLVDGVTWDSWWAYCEQHLFGRWVEDGQLWHWVLREIGEQP